MLASMPSLGNSLEGLLVAKNLTGSKTRCAGYLRKSNFEALLDRLEYLLVLVAANERDGKTLGTETTGTTDTVEVRIGISWEIVVDSQVDAFNVDTSSEYVSGHADSLVEFFELLVSADTG